MMNYETYILARLKTIRVLLNHFLNVASRRPLTDDERNERRDYEEERERITRLLRVVHHIQQ